MNSVQELHLKEQETIEVCWQRFKSALTRLMNFDPSSDVFGGPVRSHPEQSTSGLFSQNGLFSAMGG
jgi:hypothetical protein